MSAHGVPLTNSVRSAALSILAVVACVVAVDVGLRVLAPIELHRDWDHPLIAAKERLYEKFAEQDVDVLIVGSSLAMNLDAARLEKLSNRRVFNGSVVGLTAAGVSAVMQVGYAAIRNPKLVIYPLSMRDLRGGRAFEMTPFFSHKMRAARPAGWQGELEVALEDVSYLFRIRRQVRHFLVSEEREQQLDRIAKLNEHGMRGHAPHQLRRRLGNKAYKNEVFSRLVREEQATASTDNATELVKMIEANKRNGVETVLLNISISPAALAGRQKKRYKKYLSELRALAKRADVPMYDALGDLELSNGYFNDFVHLGAKGDKKVEDYLLPIIERHLHDK